MYEDRGAGWILYSWLMLVVGGGLAILEGIVALSRSSFFTAVGAHYVSGSLSTWGWVQLIMGIVAVAAGLGVALRGGMFGQLAGIIVAMASIFAQMFWIPIVPFWALTVMFLDALVIYGLSMYGGGRRTIEKARSESERHIKAA